MYSVYATPTPLLQDPSKLDKFEKVDEFRFSCDQSH